MKLVESKFEPPVRRQRAPRAVGSTGPVGKAPGLILTETRSLKPGEKKVFDVSDESGGVATGRDGENTVVDFAMVANRIQSNLNRDGALPFKVAIERSPDKNLVAVYRPATGGLWAKDAAGNIITRQVGRSNRRVTQEELDAVEVVSDNSAGQTQS